MSYVLRPAGATLPIDLSDASSVENVLAVANGGTSASSPTPDLSNLLIPQPPIGDVAPSNPEGITINEILQALRLTGVISL
jgi:hypothetical protein